MVPHATARRVPNGLRSGPGPPGALDRRARGAPRPGPSAPVRSPAMDRQCARPGCREQAVATLSYHYGRRTVWLAPLTPERVPSDHDLCSRHAVRLGVPRGWSLEDLRAHPADRARAPEPTPLAG